MQKNCLKDELCAELYSIEEYAEACSVGADAWRYTGVITFDGNVKVNKKCTYERICQHLQIKYKHSFSYGSVVQLCIARSKAYQNSMSSTYTVVISPIVQTHHARYKILSQDVGLLVVRSSRYLLLMLGGLGETLDIILSHMMCI